MIWLDCNGPPEFEAWATVDFTKDGVITIVLRCKVKKECRWGYIICHGCVALRT